jgi:hypothetical protein
MRVSRLQSAWQEERILQRELFALEDATEQLNDPELVEMPQPPSDFVIDE